MALDFRLLRSCICVVDNWTSLRCLLWSFKV